jgi:hypothetical protein
MITDHAIIQTEQDEFHLFSDNGETMNIDINLHLDEDADGNVNVVLYQQMKTGDDYGFSQSDENIIGVIRVPYALIRTITTKEETNDRR